MTKKLALVTGANKGIGLEIARGLGREGVTVLIGARASGRGEAAVGRLTAEGIDAHHVGLDVTEDESVAAAAGQVTLEFGRLDILVNNAGVARVDDSGWNTSQTSLAAARKIFDTNLIGVFAVTNAFLPLLRDSPAGRIVNVSSEVGSNALVLDPDGPLWRFQGGAYGASKAALNRLTVSYAKEFWDTPLKVNAIAPGHCATDLNNHSGHRSARQGAAVAVKMALLDADGPTGTFTGDDPAFCHPDGAVAW